MSKRKPCLADNLIQRYIGYFNRILINNSFKQFRQIRRQTQGIDRAIPVGSIELIEEPGNKTSKLTDIATLAWRQEMETIELKDCLSNLKECLLNDSSQNFQKTFIKERPDCNCQKIALELINCEGNLTKVAKELNTNYNTLRNHWKRKCIPLLKKHCYQ